MIRELTVAVAIAGAAIALAPSAGADPFPDPGPMFPDTPGHYATDVPGMVYDVDLSAPCDNYQLFTFGRGRGGASMVCHYIPNQWPPVYTGFWVSSYPIQGVKDIGSPCAGPKMAAQAPDGRPMVCLGAQGWQPGTLTGAGFFPG
jgi:hypothetical protein